MNGSARPTRRDIVAGGAAAAALAVAGAERGAAGESAVPPSPSDAAAFMDRAFAMRRLAEAAGDQSYGAVLVLDGQIVAETPSAVVTASDPTAHAEMQAIRESLRRVGGKLDGAVLYSTSRPCPMCEAAAHRAGVRLMIHGAGLVSAGAPRPGPAP